MGIDGINNRNGNKTPMPAGRRVPLQARWGYFNAAEGARFIAPFNELNNRRSTFNYQPSLQELLTCEIEAMLAVDKEVDQSKMNVNRRKALESLGSGNREHYVGFLLELADLYTKQNEKTKASDILTTIILQEPNNWQAVKLFGLLLLSNGQKADALESFSLANQIELAMPGQRIREFDRWEMKAREASLRLEERLKSGARFELSELDEILEPFFKVPDYSATVLKIYEEIMQEIIKNLVIYNAPEIEMASLLRATVDGERTAYQYLARAIKSRLTGNGAEGEEKARDLIVEASKLGLIGRETEKELNSKLADLILEEKTAGRMENLYKQMDREEQIDPAELDLVLKDGDRLVQADGWKTIMGEMRRSVAEWIGGQLKKGIDLEGEMTMAAELAGRDVRLKGEIIKQLAGGLRDSLVKNKILDVLTKIKERIAAAGDQEQEGPDGVNDRSIYQLFFVEMKDLPECRQLFKELIGIDYAVPAAFESFRLQMIAGQKSDDRDALDYVQRSYDADRENLVSRLELIRVHTVLGNHKEAAARIDGLLAEDHNATVRIRVFCFRIVNLRIQMLKLAKQHNGVNQLQELAAKAEQIYLQLKSETENIDWQKQAKSIIISDFHTIHVNMAVIQGLLLNFERAMVYYTKILDVMGDGDREATIGIANLLLMQGKYDQVKGLIIRAIDATKGKILAFYDYLLETNERDDDYNGVLQVASAMLLSDRGPSDRVRTLIARGKALAALENIAVAEKTMAEVEGLLRSNEEFAKKYRPDLLVFKADIMAAKDNFSGAERAYLQAIDIFSKTNSNYAEMIARYKLAKIFGPWASATKRLADRRNIYKAGLLQAQILIRQFPYFPGSHKVLITPLMGLGQEKKGMEEFAWLVDRPYAVDDLIFGNLLLFAAGSQSETQQKAKDLFIRLKDNMGAIHFRMKLKKAMLIIERCKYDFAPEEELKKLLDEAMLQNEILRFKLEG